MSNGSGCGQASGYGAPHLQPPAQAGYSEGDTLMSDSSPTLNPPSHVAESSGASDAAPTMMPEAASAAAFGGGVAAWLNNKRVGGLWVINQNRNSWVYVTGVGWKKLANNSDSAIVALSLLAGHAKQSQSSYNYREEADGMIHETYVW